MSKRHAIKQGDVVRVVTPHQDAGKVGTVTEVLRETAKYYRRARVRLSAGYQPIIGVEYLVSAEGES